VLWAGVADNRSLLDLHASIDAVLRHAIDFQGERRPYSPHITLARLNSPVAARFIEEYLNVNRDLRIASHLVTQFALYSSDVAEEAPKYRREAVFRLA
jgi:2'-5' RNA ligase